ncbi:IS3 family transposase [Bacillus toyonensis]
MSKQRICIFLDVKQKKISIEDYIWFYNHERFQKN